MARPAIVTFSNLPGGKSLHQESEGLEPKRLSYYPRPGFRSLLPVRLGKYMVKMSSSESPTTIMIFYWVGRPEPSHWIVDGRRTAQVAFFQTEEKTKEFLNKLEKEQ
jgi:hypothetical protein